MQAGDFAILFRALSDVAFYEDVFRRRGIDYYLVGGRAFFAQQEVYDLVNLCAFLNDPDDAISLVGILRSPFFSLSDDTVVASRDSAHRSVRRWPRNRRTILPSRSESRSARPRACLPS